MYQSIGINLSKKLDASTKRIKVPAITQRSYYKDSDNCEEEFINFYKSDSDYNNIDYYNDDIRYLDDDYEESINDDFESSCGCCDGCSLMNKMKNIDSKVAVMVGVGALIGFIGLYKLLKRK
ncbi:MAG: hypothetical protein E7D27_00570 [Clostridium celatum]|nr:hypothetical protein [Clostridium celatum]